MSKNSSGMKKNLTNYGDTGFSIFLRKAFIKGLGYSDDMLDKKIIGISSKVRTDAREIDFTIIDRRISIPPPC